MDTKRSDRESFLTEETIQPIPQLQEPFFPLYPVEKHKTVNIIKDLRSLRFLKKKRKSRKQSDQSERNRTKRVREIHIASENSVRKFWECIKNKDNIEDPDCLFSAGTNRKKSFEKEILKESYYATDQAANIFKKQLLNSLSSIQKNANNMSSAT